jgi:hypothetical protein
LVQALDRLDSQQGAARKRRAARAASTGAKGRQRAQGVQVLELFEADSSGSSQGPSAAAPSGGIRQQPARASLEQFARDVLASAQHSPSGWVSSERVFISHAWQAYRKAHPSRPPGLSVFKTLLLQARGQGLLELAEDEMAPFHRRTEVQRSASESGGRRLHLLCVRRSLASWRKGR